VADAGERGNETLGSTKSGDFLDRLKKHRFLKKDSVTKLINLSKELVK
jgi:hypothetical protein